MPVRCFSSMPNSKAGAHAKSKADPPAAEFIGNHPVLDFHNTLAWPTPRGENERLMSASDLIRWSRAAGLVTVAEAEGLERRASEHRGESRRVIKHARRVRGLLHETLSLLARGKPLSSRDLDKLNAEVGVAVGSLRLSGSNRRIEWATDERAGLAVILRRLVWSAAQLLTSPDLSRLRSCANAECGWLFLDTSKNRSRRWCSMDDCGSRAKSRRYYRRVKKLRDRKGQ